MVEIELVRRRRSRRQQRRRRSELVLAAAVTLAVVAAVVVALAALSSPEPDPRRTPGAAAGLPGLDGPAAGPSERPADEEASPPEFPEDPAASPEPSESQQGEPGAEAPSAEPAGAILSDDGGADPVDLQQRPPAVSPLSPVVPDSDPSEPQEPDGPLTRVVDPLLARVTALLPQLAPVREAAHEVTTCVEKAGTGCPVPASTSR